LNPRSVSRRTTRRRGRPPSVVRPPGPLLGLLLFAGLIGAAVPAAAAGAPPVADEAVAGAARPVSGLAATGVIHPAEVRDPFFRFVFGSISVDSLGVWSRADLERAIAATGQTTRLPLDRVVSVERRAAVGAERERRAGAEVVRIWRIVLTNAFKLPMPYSILGYHPGSLMFSQTVVLSEWHLGDPLLEVTIDGRERSFSCAGLVALRVDEGYLVLDADGWLDALLGKNLDDSWTTGFGVGRVNGRLIGVGISLNRDGRKIYGELDFTKDEVMPHGRPPARALSRYCRTWTTPPAGRPERAWCFEDSTGEQ
jgi:hypothetical protein